MEQVNVIGMEGETLKIALSGDIDLSNAEAFYNEIMTAYVATPANVTFVWGELNFIDSTTLGTFVKIFKTIEKNGHVMRLTELQSKIKKLFVICSLDRIMQLA